MLKSEIRDYLKDEIIEDAIYTEKIYEASNQLYIECSVWSASAGYTVTIRRKVNSDNNRNVQMTRAMLVDKVLKEKEKFTPRFDYTEDDPLEGLEALLNDGFDYDEF